MCWASSLMPRMLIVSLKKILICSNMFLCTNYYSANQSIECKIRPYMSSSSRLQETCLRNVLCDFMQNFGLDVQTFQHMVGDCPPDFLEMAVSCCTVRCLLGISLFVCVCVCVYLGVHVHVGKYSSQQKIRQRITKS